jgi:type IV secretory pathway VirB4 component
VLGELRAVLLETDAGRALADRLERYVSGSLHRLLQGQTNVDLGRSLISFNLRELEDELRPVATYLIADHVWTRARAGLRRPCHFVVEEAWSALCSREGLDLMLGLAKRGRKYWLGLTTITQDVEDCLASPEGRAVVANAAVHLLMKQSPSSIEVVAATFKLTEPEQRELLAARRGDGLLCALGTRLPIRIEASPREHALLTTNPAELAAANAA